MELVLEVWDREPAEVSDFALQVWARRLAKGVFPVVLVAAVCPGVVAAGEPGVVAVVGVGRPCTGGIRLRTGWCRLPPSGHQSRRWTP